MDVLVMASNRIDMAVSCLAAWRGTSAWDLVVLVEDAAERSPKVADADVHLCWRDAHRLLGDDQWVISRRDSAVKALGFLEAVRLGAQRVHVLDDDCLPYGDVDVRAGHAANLSGRVPVWASSVEALRVRGIPYDGVVGTRDVALSMGLWAGVPDTDAITDVRDGQRRDFTPPRGVVLPGAQYVPLCGMNFAFRRDILPLLYFPLMGEGQPFGRWDDIWAGLAAKKCLDALGLHMSVGEPHVFHSRASSPWSNLVKEARGYELHSFLWPIVDATGIPRGAMPAEAANLVGRSLEASRSAAPNWASDYVKRYGEALRRWAAAADRILSAQVSHASAG